MLEITQAFCLLLISGVFPYSLGSSDFHLISLFKNYEDAKRYCREMYTDLATIHNFTDMTNLINYVSDTSIRAWVGLEIGNKRMWHWSLPGQKLNYVNWQEGHPQVNDQDKCAAMDENGKWFESDCKSKRGFVCHGNEGTSSHVYFPETKSWRDAQNHCRGLSTDLVSVQSATENEAVKNMAQNDVWIGLFKDPWIWSDGSSSSFRNWRPFQPNYIEGQDCATALFQYSGEWNDLKCSGKRKFICRGASKAPTTVQTSTTVTNLTTLSNVTSESVEVTIHFTVASNNTDSVTVSTPSNSVFSSSTKHLSLTTSPVTTESSSASTNTTQSLTSTPHSNMPGNLILIQQNMTWVEATAYCREHYIDLVYISTTDLQQRVAEKAEKATTPHVWIGLRYTCSAKVWFWTRSASGCYQNWAPGQGTEGTSSCGFTGAIEATGRQQWIGLPQTEKLNFICYTCIG